MNINLINLVIKVIILMLLAGCSEFALSQRKFGITIFLFSVYLSVFRRTFLAAIASYSGLFNHIPYKDVSAFQSFLTEKGATFTDIVMLIASVFLFFSLLNSYKKRFTDGK